MTRKNVALPYTLASAQSLAATFTSSTFTITYLDNVGIAIDATTSDAVGTFTIEAAIGDSAWTDLAVTPAMTLASANASFLVNLNQAPFSKIRVVYARTSGTGTVDIRVMAKGV